MFFAAVFLDFGGAALWFLGESEAEDLRLARRFIHPAKGRLRVCRSLSMSISTVWREIAVEEEAHHGVLRRLRRWPWSSARMFAAV